MTILLFSFCAYGFFKKNRKETLFNAIFSILFNLSIVNNFPVRKISLLPFNFAYILLLISVLDIFFVIQFSYKETFRELSKKDKNTFFGILAIFLPFALLPIYSNPGTSENFANFNYPFNSGNYYIIQGGNNPLINAHYFYKDQKFALDLIKLCEKENTIENKYKSNEDFCIWNEPVTAICDGTIMGIESSLKDNIAYSESDNKNPKGNHILLKCTNNYEILYAHLKKDSIKYSIGSAVKAGTLLGNVGNSGNTTEPHLHIQANLNGKPQVLFFKNTSYKKHDVIKI